MSEIPADPEPFPGFRVATTTEIYDSHWVSLRRDTLELSPGVEQEYHRIGIAQAVCVVPVLPDGSIVVLWQHRHPLGETHWEVPAGRRDEDESLEEAARREVLEETGFRAGRLEPLARFHPVNGISDHEGHLFTALDCERVGEPAHDPQERISVHVMPAGEVRARLLRGDFVDGFSALALFHHFARRDTASAGS